VFSELREYGIITGDTVAWFGVVRWWVHADLRRRLLGMAEEDPATARPCASETTFDKASVSAPRAAPHASE
jgi:hypothetical protein